MSDIGSLLQTSPLNYSSDFFGQSDPIETVTVDGASYGDSTLTAPNVTSDFTSYLSDLFATTPGLSVASTPAGSYNAVANPTPASGGITYNDLQQAAALAASLARTGVQTYASVNAIQHGAGAPLVYSPSQLGQGVTIDPATGDAIAPAATPFTVADLTDFSKPYPYLLAGGALVLLLVLTKGKKKGR